MVRTEVMERRRWPRVLGSRAAWAAAAVAVGGSTLLASGAAAARVSGFDLDAASTSVLRGKRLYVDGNSAASRQVAAWRSTRPGDAALLEREVASQPSAVWFGDWNRSVRSDVARVVADAARQKALAVLVAYNIPQRDCGSHSAGGAADAAAYRKWIGEFAKGLDGRGSVVVLEPDALASTKCLSASARAERFALLKFAVQTLKARNAYVYIDAGHPNWLSAEEAASRLQQAGVAEAAGFSLNVSNFVGNAANIRYGNAISRRTGRNYVIDSSRNGAGGNGEWCNPNGRALGTRPTTNTAHPNVDAFLWVKKPGESDGSCNGGPRAGQFWSEYALQLAQRSTPLMALADADA